MKEIKLIFRHLHEKMRRDRSEGCADEEDVGMEGDIITDEDLMRMYGKSDDKEDENVCDRTKRKLRNMTSCSGKWLSNLS